MAFPGLAPASGRRRAEAWTHSLTRILTIEIREAIHTGTITVAEAEELLPRLVLVIDQAIGDAGS